MTLTCRLFCLATALCACLPLRAEDAKSSGTSSVAESSALSVFEAMQSRQIEVKLTQKSEKSGTLFLRNPTKESVTVEFPESFVGIHVTNPNFLAANNGQALPQTGGGTTAQSTANSINFAATRAAADAPEPESLDKTQPADAKKKTENKERQVEVPPGKTVQLPVTSVCLEYGKPEPNSKMPYLIIPVERYSRNPVLHELLPLFAQHRISQKTAQAAAWHVSNGLSWVELSSIMGQGPVPAPMFNRATLQQANLLVNEATAIAVQRRSETPQKPTEKSPRTGRAKSSRTNKPPTAAVQP